MAQEPVHEYLKSQEEYFADWESHVFGFGYGTGETHVLQALKVFLNTFVDGKYDYNALEGAIGAPAAWLLINTLCQAEILEYGTSARFGWLTPEGAALNAFVTAHSVDDLVKLTDLDLDNNYNFCSPDACNCGPNGYDQERVCPNPFWRHS